MKNPHQKRTIEKGVIKPRRWCHHSLNISEMEMKLAMVETLLGDIVCCMKNCKSLKHIEGLTRSITDKTNM